jgi:HD-GYP domain-containing protein (c-di-GMP phosphodiesterase class II)
VGFKSRTARAEAECVRIVAVSRLRPGMRLGRPVYSCSGGVRIPLLQPQAEITDRVRLGLERAGVFAVYVDDAISEGIAPTEVISPELRERAIKELHETFGAVATAGPATRIPGEQIERLEGVVAGILRELRGHGQVVSTLMDLHTFDSHTLAHSLNVCVIGLMLGDEHLRRHGWRDGRGRQRHDDHDVRLQKLGTGLLLHDVGKLLIPAEILRKPGRLTADEMALVREHPRAGLDLVEGGSLASLAKVCILGHHERLDGRGYPDGRGADLHENAQIAGLADVYDAVSSMRVYQARRPTHEAWELVMSLGTAFPLELVKIFKETVAPYPEGVAVRLSDGRRGIVSKVHRDHVSRPTVRVTGEEGGAVTPYDVDLFTRLDVTILDTLEDLDGPAGADRPEPAHASDELQEQRLAGVVAG